MSDQKGKDVKKAVNDITRYEHAQGAWVCFVEFLNVKGEITWDKVNMKMKELYDNSEKGKKLLADYVNVKPADDGMVT